MEEGQGTIKVGWDTVDAILGDIWVVWHTLEEILGWWDTLEEALVTTDIVLDTM